MKVGDATDPAEASRITENLFPPAELTDLCLELRLAVLKETCSDREAREKVMSEVRQAKERAGQNNRS